MLAVEFRANFIRSIQNAHFYLQKPTIVDVKKIILQILENQP